MKWQQKQVLKRMFHQLRKTKEKFLMKELSVIDLAKVTSFFSKQRSISIKEIRN